MDETITALRDRLGEPGWDVLIAVAAAALAVIAALIAHRIIFRVLGRIARASESQSDDIVLARLERPTRYAMAVLGLALAARETPLLEGVWVRVAGFVMPALIGWIALAIMLGLVRALELKADITQPDNLAARRRRTRLAILSRIGTFIIIFVTVGLMLLSIPGVRDVGVTLMASAGLAGLAVGAAAQPALKSLIAGMQMALTEPINIDDVVVIEGHTGRIEDIHTTYVVLHTWDERRLIVPTVRFLETTFENWTRGGAEILAPVILQLSPMTDIAPLRTEFMRQVQAHELWDGRVARLQVTDMTAGAMEVRLVASAGDCGRAFALQCDLRETMLRWIREHQRTAIVGQS